MDMNQTDCGFRVESSWEGDSSAVTIEGELDLASSSCLEDQLEDLRAHGISDHLIVDMTSCTFVDSTGLAVLMTAQKAAKSRLNVVATDPQVVRTLHLTALDQLFLVHPDRESAYEALSRQANRV
jgi:anti-anti-sigma factor